MGMPFGARGFSFDFRGGGLQLVKVVDKLLLLLYSVVIGIVAIWMLCVGFGLISLELMQDWVINLYGHDAYQITWTVVAGVLLLFSLRFLIVSLQRSSSSTGSIDQRTDIGDIRISIETIENLALKAAARQRGVKDLRARVRATDAGIEIMLRTIVDGESSIPALTEEIQRTVKDSVEEITGIPVINVAVFIANVVQSGTFKSRVE